MTQLIQDNQDNQVRLAHLWINFKVILFCAKGWKIMLSQFFNLTRNEIVSLKNVLLFLVFYWDWCLDWEVTLCATLEFGPLGVAKGVCPSATRNGDRGEPPGKSEWIRKNKSSVVLWQIGLKSRKQILRGFMANPIQLADFWTGTRGQRCGNVSWIVSQKMSETRETEKCGQRPHKRNIEQMNKDVSAFGGKI